MRSSVAITFLVGGLGCRAVLGIEDPPEGPGSTSVATSTSLQSSGATSGDGGATTAEVSASASAGGGGAIGAGGATAASGSTTSAGGAGGDGGGPTTFVVEGDALRLADAGDDLAVVVRNATPPHDIQWIPRTGDELGALAGGVVGDEGGLGYLIGHEGSVYYSTYTNIRDGAGATITRVQPDGSSSQFAATLAEFGGMTIRGADLLYLPRNDSDATSTLGCKRLTGDRICTGLSRDASAEIEEAFALLLVGDDGPWWTVRLVDGRAEILGGDAPLFPFSDLDPLDVAFAGPGRPWALGAGDGVAAIGENGGAPLCTFDADEALGFDVDDAGHVFLPHAQGLAICQLNFRDCVLARGAPVRDVLVTADAIFHAAAGTVTRTPRPIEGWLETLEAFTACGEPR